MEKVTRVAKLVAVTAVGGLLIIAGIAMLALPGPGILVIIAGLAVLAIEYSWAQRLRDDIKKRIRRYKVHQAARRDDASPSAIIPGGEQQPSAGDFHNVA